MSDGEDSPPVANDGLQESQEEWKLKLEALQGQPPRETPQQQREHLNQLHLLQKKLLQDISVNKNYITKKIEMEEAEVEEETKGEPVNQRGILYSETKKNEVISDYLDPSNGAGVPIVTRQRRFTYTISSPSNPSVDKFLVGDVSIEESKNLPLPTCREDTWNTSVKHSGNDPNAPHEELVPKKKTPDSRMDGNDRNSNDNSPLGYNCRSGSDEHKYFSYASGLPLTPPKQAWTTPLTLHSPSPLGVDRQTSPQNNPLSTRSFSPSPGLHSERETSLRRSIESHQVRSILTQKHAKHIEDLRNYYETEISMLVKKSEGGTRETTPTRRSLNFDEIQCTPSRPIPLGLHEQSLAGETLPVQDAPRTSPQARIVKSENLRLEAECSRLHQLLEEADRQCHTLLDQEKKAEKYALEWQRRCDSAEKTVGVLQDRLGITIKRLQDQDMQRKELQSDLEIIVEELHLSKRQRNEDIEKIDQIFHEFEVFKLENDELRRANENYRTELERNDSELTSLRASLEKYKTMDIQNKSTIHTLEEEVRHLEHIKNRRHNMGTHYELGTYRPMHDKHDEDVGDETKTHSVSHLLPLSSSYHGYPILNEPLPVQRVEPLTEMTTPVTSLTRKKWLEPSDPGLFGGTPKYDKACSTPPSDSVHTSRQDNNIGLRSSLGSNIEKVKSDNKSAVSFHRNLAGADVDAMLKAIRRGRISASADRDTTRAEKSEEKIRKHVEVVADADKRLAMLNSERDKIESSLRRTPKGGKVNRVAKQMQFDKERRLEEVTREISSVRMVLRKHHALKI